MKELNEQTLFHGVSVDLMFRGEGPEFGDLFVICGYENPNFPPTGRFDFASLSDLRFSQTADYFGVKAETDEGGDVVVWLYPLLDDQTKHHHPGPFDGLRLSYSPLRHPPRRAEHFGRVVSRMATALPVDVVYQTRGRELSLRDALEQIQHDISAIEGYWAEAGISPGSPEALEL